MANVFKDYIPEGEPQGGQGKGFVDYIPEPVPEYHKEEAVEEVKPIQEIQPIKKGKKI